MIKIFVDSAANIPAKLVKKYDINVIPFINKVGDKNMPGFVPELSEEEERQNGKEYYDAIRNGMEVTTSLVNSENFKDKFEIELKNGNDIIYFSLSKYISGTYNAARMASEELLEIYKNRKIRLVDSLNASLAQGILAIYARMMIDNGKDIDEIADCLSNLAYKMNGVFTVEDLKYLSKSGRISNVTSIVGNALKIKPLLKGNKDGVIVQFKKIRGRKKSLQALVDIVCNNIIEPEKQIVGIAHADAYEESLYVMEEIEKRVKVKEFINTTYDYCTGAHVGPGTIALFFIANDRELNK